VHRPRRLYDRGPAGFKSPPSTLGKIKKKVQLVIASEWIRDCSGRGGLSDDIDNLGDFGRKFSGRQKFFRGGDAPQGIERRTIRCRDGPLRETALNRFSVRGGGVLLCWCDQGPRSDRRGEDPPPPPPPGTKGPQKRAGFRPTNKTPPWGYGCRMRLRSLGGTP